MTTTTAAAAQANVTVATIRTWCRRNVIAAIKQAGRWVIDTASLAHRIAIGQRKIRVTQPPIHLTSRTTIVPGHPGAVGPVNVLRAAYETGQQVTLDGKFAGERVYLGHSRQTYGDAGITLETIGLDRELGEAPGFPGVQAAVYLVDLTRLDDAPQLAAMVRQVEGRTTARAAAAEQRAADEEDRHLNREDEESPMTQQQPRATDRQVNYIMRLISDLSDSDFGLEFYDGPTQRGEIEALSQPQASTLIENLKDLQDGPC